MSKKPSATDVEAMAAMPDKIEGRTDYIKGKGFTVEVRATYTRVRKVRALTEEDAMQYALSREAQFAPKYFGPQAEKDVQLVSIEAMSAEQVTNE